jgi:hypothetical protein
LLSALLVAACHTERDEAVRAEAAVVAHQIVALRTCPPEYRPAFRKVLADLPCTAKDVCDLRNLCNQAYELDEAAHAALGAIDHATRQTDAPVPPEAAALLQRAEADLGRSKDLALRCVDSEGELRRRYRL